MPPHDEGARRAIASSTATKGRTIAPYRGCSPKFGIPENDVIVASMLRLDFGKGHVLLWPPAVAPRSGNNKEKDTHDHQAEAARARGHR